MSALLVLAAAALLAAGCGDDDSPGPGPGPLEVPAAWAGIWRIRIVERACGDDVVRSEQTAVDTLCTGDSVDFGNDLGGDSGCTGTVTDTVIDAACTSTFLLQNIGYTIDSSFRATREGDSFTGTGRVTVKVGMEEYSCSDVELSGTRIGAAPAGCGGSAAPIPRGRAFLPGAVPAR